MEQNNLIAKLVDKISYLDDRVHTVITESSSIAIETQSKELDKLAPLLPTVQSEIGNIGKNKKNEHYKYKYADLDAILASVFPIINKHGLYLYFEVLLWNRKRILRTKLIHGESLQWIGTLATLPPEEITNQEYGKAESYQKRYSVKNLLGITTSDDVNDDDGETERKSTYSKNSSSGNTKFITDKQLGFLKNLIDGRVEIEEKILQQCGVDNLTELSISDATSSIDILMSTGKK